MKLLIASDIHGSAYFCRKLINRYKEEKADLLVLLGDILYHGPRNDLPYEYDPKSVIAMLNPLSSEIVCVRGNCEAEVDDMVLSFPVLSDYSEILTEKNRLFLTHGHKFSKDNHPPLREGTVLLSGHTHVPHFEEKDGIIFCNPGSVSIPKENSHNSYVIIEKDTLSFKTIDGETYRVEKI